MMFKKASFEATREVRSFADLAHGADVLLMKSENGESNHYYTTMVSLLLMAFTFEAYLNHLGEKKIKFWDKIEAIKVMDKFAVLCQELGLSPDFSHRPYQTLKALFQFRNAIAHGRTTILNVTKPVSPLDAPFEYEPKVEWEECCTVENAQRAKKDVAQIIEELNRKAGFGAHPFTDSVAVCSFSLERHY